MKKLTREDISALLTEVVEIPQVVRAMGFVYVQTMSDAEVDRIGTVAAELLERLRQGDTEGALAALREYGVPGPLLTLVEKQVGMYAAKISQNPRE